MRGNHKPFGKWLSLCAEMPNHSGNDSRQARKRQTSRETTFAKRGNHKPFGKELSPSDRSIKCFDNGFEQEWKFPTLLRDHYSVGTNSTILLSSFLFFIRITHEKWRETISLYNSLCSIKCNRKIKKERQTHTLTRWMIILYARKVVYLSLLIWFLRN